MPKKSERVAHRNPPIPVLRVGAQKKRPTSAGASRQSSRPASASRQRPTEDKGRDERVHLRAEVARLEGASTRAASLAGAHKHAPAPQRAPAPQQRTPDMTALETSVRELRQRAASDEREKGELQCKVAELVIKHDAAQVQLKRAAQQLAVLRSKKNVTDAELEAELNSEKLQDMLEKTKLQDDNAALTHDNAVLHRRLEAMRAELAEARAHGHAAQLMESARLGLAESAVNVELGFSELVNGEGGGYVVKLSG